MAELRARPLSKLRIILAPVDVPTQGNWQAHLDLFDALQVPAAFIQERVQNVCTSFGSQFRLGDGCSAVWFHSLFKAIELDSLGRVKAGHGLDLNVNPGLSVSQANFDWYKSAFFLSWTRVVDKPTSLTLCCWSAPLELETALEALFQHGDPTVLLRDPFTLLATAAHELYLELNQQVARMATAHGRLESDTLSLAAATAQSGRTVTFDFVGLSNISKHIIHLGEGTRGALGTIDAMLECHGEMAGLFDEDSRSETRQKLRHTRMMLRSTELQMASLEKRVQNLTSLAFNSVAQYNNQVLLLDSLNMRTIAVVTLCFLPMTALAVRLGDLAQVHEKLTERTSRFLRRHSFQCQTWAGYKCIPTSGFSGSSLSRSHSVWCSFGGPSCASQWKSNMAAKTTLALRLSSTRLSEVK